MSKAHERMAQLSAEQKAQLEKQRKIETEATRRKEEEAIKRRALAAKKAEAERLRRKAEAAAERAELRKEAEKVQREVLSDLKTQAKEISKEKTKLNSLIEWKNNLDTTVSSQLDKVAKTKSDLTHLTNTINTSEAKLERLKRFEKRLHREIDELMDQCAATKAEAVKMRDNWEAEYRKSVANKSEIIALLREGKGLKGTIISELELTNCVMADVEYAEAVNEENFEEIAKKEIEFQRKKSKLLFIDSNEAISTSAFATFEALQKKNYTLRQVISEDSLTAWFEKIDERGNKKEIFVKISQSAQEGGKWLEELDISKGFLDDECLDESEEIMFAMEKLGVEYVEVISSDYPKRSSAKETEWQDRLRRSSTNRSKMKN